MIQENKELILKEEKNKKSENMKILIFIWPENRLNSDIIKLHAILIVCTLLKIKVLHDVIKLIFCLNGFIKNL